VSGGRLEDAPADGWLVLACFHTLWSAASVRVIPAITDIVPLYQDLMVFLKVRADSRGLSSVTKSLNISSFPTFILFRGGKEVADGRIVGDDKVIDKIIRLLNSNVKASDKIAHSKRRHRLKVERAIAMGEDPSLITSGEDETTKKVMLDWTWDTTHCGELIAVEHYGMTVVLNPEVDYSDGTWEYSKNNRKWFPVSVITNKMLEAAYKLGKLYKDSRAVFSDIEVFVTDEVAITSWQITGFSGELRDGKSNSNCQVRRSGERLSVPGEEPYLSKEQKAIDEQDAEWRKANQERRQAWKDSMRGSDVQGVRGVVAMLPQSGVHKWALVWHHDPPRGGSCDGVGLCGDACERYGPTTTPLFGSSDGMSLALYADGRLYYNNKLLSQAQKSPDSLLLFGKNSIVTVEFDTDNNGGTMKIFVDEKFTGIEVSEIFDMLGDKEVYPCVCMCPFDATAYELMPPIGESADEGENSEPKNAFVPQSPCVTLYLDMTLLSKNNTSAQAESENNIAPTHDETDKPTDNSADTELQNQGDKAPSVASIDTTRTIAAEKIRWLYESDNCWTAFPQEVCYDIEMAQRDGKTEYSFTIADANYKCDLEYNVYSVDNNGQKRLKRFIKEDGVKGQWEMLSLCYKKQSKFIQGETLINTLEKVWSGNENMDGRKLELGFLFLYSLLTGDIKAKVLSSGGDFAGIGKNNYFEKYSRYGAGNMSVGSSSDDSHRFAMLMVQLYRDKHSKGILASVVNVLCRNRQVALRMPKFVDTRTSTNSSQFNGWCDEAEPVSPLADLFANLAPVLSSLKNKGALHFPPPPPHPELPNPETAYPHTIFSDLQESNQSAISDYACDNRTLNVISGNTMSKMAALVKFRLSSNQFKSSAPIVVADSTHFRRLLSANVDKLVAVYFHTEWGEKCKVYAPIFRLLSVTLPGVLYLKVTSIKLQYSYTLN
jgi:hypothetical protein